MGETPHPGHPDEITPEWLTDRLRDAGALGEGHVTSFTSTPVGVGIGMLGVLARIVPTYDPPAPEAPRSLIAKFATPHDGNRAVAMHFRVYEREIRFYGQVAPHVGEIAPRCFFWDFDAGRERSVLLLEDLGEYRMGDQVAGCAAAEAEAIIDALAPMHARYWGQVDDPSLAWAPRIDGQVQTEGMTAACAGAWQTCVDRFGAVMAPGLLAARDRFLAAVPELHRMMGRCALTLIHGDVRLDNLMFGAAPGHRPVVLLDWTLTVSSGVHDLAYLMSQNLLVEERRANERRLIERYHRLLVEAGVTGYSLDQAWADYRLALLYVIVYAVVIAGGLDPGNERGRRFMEELVRRTSAAWVDHDLEALLPN